MEDPSKTSFFLQKQVRENSQDLERFMLDLKNWEDGMKQKEKNILDSSDKENEPQEKKPVTREDVTYVKEVFEDGVKQMKKGKWESAIKSFSNAIRKYKKNPAFFLKRAKCYLKLKKAKEAEADCSVALSIDPKLLKAKLIRSQAREMMGHYRGACLDLQDILILDPPNVIAKELLDSLKPKLKECLQKDGFQQFDIEPETENRNDILDLLVRNENDIEESEVEEKKAKADEEKKKGNAFVKAGNWEEAKKAYSRAILNYPNDPIYYANRAWCYLNGEKKDEQRAIFDCNVALQKNPSYTKVYMRRATAKKAIGDLWGARSDIKMMLILEPNHTQAKQYLEELNVLIEKKLFENYEYLEPENSNSEDEVDQPFLEPTNDEYFSADDTDFRSQGPNQKSDTKNASEAGDNKPKSEVCSKEVIGQKEFKYVFPVDKPVHKRSKKPLKRIPIKFLDSNFTQIPPSNPKVEKLPDWIATFGSKLSSLYSEELTPKDSTVNNNYKKNSNKNESETLTKQPEPEVCSAAINDKKDFSYIFPIDKPENKKSKKPLKRIPIKVIDGNVLPQKHQTFAADYLINTERQSSGCEPLRRPSPVGEDNHVCIPKKQKSSPAKIQEITEENMDFISDSKDFKYIFPIDKKPHQRSKKPLLRIPIKFAG